MLVTVAISLTIFVILSGCASTKLSPGVVSAPPGDQVACLNFIRSKGYVGAPCPLVVMLMSNAEMDAASDVFCFIKRGVRIPASKNAALIEGSFGDRFVINAAKYIATTNVVITIPAKVHDAMMLSAASQNENAQTMASMSHFEKQGGHNEASSQSYDMALASLSGSIGMIIVDEISRVELSVPKAEFERLYCDRVVYGKAIGCVGPGGRLSYNTSPGAYVVQTWVDMFKFQGHVDWENRTLSAPLSVQIKAGRTYDFTFTPNFNVPPTIKTSWEER
jgi:hypothetical protein